MAPTITEHQVLDAFFAQKLGKTYQQVKIKHDRLKRTVADIFAFYGVELDLSTTDKEKAFLPLILHFDYIAKKIKNFQKISKSAVYEAFPDKNKPFFSDNLYKDAPFIKVPVAR